MKRSVEVVIAVIFFVVLTGCATTKLTVDDGRKLDNTLVSNMKAYGTAAAALRPAIVRSAALHDKDCSTQYELPFEALTSYSIQNEDEKIAWVRALGVRENLTVIAADASSGLAAGDVITEVAGYKSSNTSKMVDELVEARDDGKPFGLKLASGRKVQISPVKACRGHVVVASPLSAAAQKYHWTESQHPLEMFHQPLTPDEAEWVVLWTQGLSEQAGARMKTYAFMVGSVKWIAILAFGVAASSATASVRGAAAAVGSSSTGQVAAVQLANQAASLMARAAANRAELSGINGIAAGLFDSADKWAFENMKKLGMNPRAGLSLHAKLIAQGAAMNAFLLDEQRLAGMQKLVAGLPDEKKTKPAVIAKPPPSDVPVKKPDGSTVASTDHRSVAELDVRNAVEK